METTNTVSITDKTQLVYLTSKGVKPIKAERDNKVVKVTYLNDENFKKITLDFMVDEEFKSYKMAEKTVEQLLRTTV